MAKQATKRVTRTKPAGRTVRPGLTLREILLASRPFSWVNTAAPFIAGAYLGLRGQTELSGVAVPLVVATIYFTFPYNLLVYGINDIYDYESDVKNPRKGGIEGGVLPKYKHRDLWQWIIALNVPFVLFLILASNSLLLDAWLVGIIFMALAYSVKGLRFKEVPLLDSFTSSWHFWSPLMYGLLIGGNPVNHILPAIAAFILWGMASQALGAIKDITYDRSAGIGSIASSLGAKMTAWFCTLFYSAAAIIPPLFFGWAGAAGGLVLALYAINVARCIPGGDNPAAYRPPWQLFMKLNFFSGFALTIILLRVYILHA